MKSKLIYELQQPEYIGENRCGPCTILNILLAILFSSLIARKSRLNGYLTFGGAVALIYLRGYLIPGTPALTKQYLPSEVLRWFGKEPKQVTCSGLGADTHNLQGRTADSVVETEEVDPYEYLLTETILEPCEESDDLCLVDQFGTKWQNEMERVYDTDLEASKVASVFGVQIETEIYEIIHHENVQMLMMGEKTIGKWPSHEALVADIGAVHTLDEYAEAWDSLSPIQKGTVLNSLRLFIQQCPEGDGSVSIKEDTIETCCSSLNVVSVVCDETGAQLFEQTINN